MRPNVAAYISAQLRGWSPTSDMRKNRAYSLGASLAEQAELLGLTYDEALAKVLESLGQDTESHFANGWASVSPIGDVRTHKIAPVYPPGAAKLWMRGADPPAEWRSINMAGRRDVARVVEDECGLDWAKGWTGRLIVPLYDEHGTVRSVKSRALDSDTGPKERNPQGYIVRDLALVSPGAVAILRGHTPPADHVILVEGVPDFLTWAVREPIVVGLYAGCSTDACRAILGATGKVRILTHDDAAGRHYLDKLKGKKK